MLLSQWWLSPAEKAGLARSQEFRSTGLGYFQEQATKPQTLGYTLPDSPVGLLAWIYEKLVAWSDKYPWDDDKGPFPHAYLDLDILVFAPGPAVSLPIYHQLSPEDGVTLPSVFDVVPTIPLRFSYFPGEPFKYPRKYFDLPYV
ncbi:hypothetical protein C8R44DRAFT_886147 [Mycena epipterygia]|nr:hypothetical protein C8R44DRAFT_886147 [Mycena epipterygia]